ncbi:hypothetical protein Val02_76730 [Virgisporangium aliadipatigenens]|uniref:Uncharacterized protein n=1 Tax=Virgisporangium aliadipatigenens TaxID=741659 RepID=A0A8J4DW48_9ACTN|nr:hypothetical protein [Virgisporangium aliadipatigenens]GIJ50787.1 hypothetical protein Val02_76730 [Virgisporangium aliadipatigenens]
MKRPAISVAGAAEVLAHALRGVATAYDKRDAVLAWRLDARTVLMLASWIEDARRVERQGIIADVRQEITAVTAEFAEMTDEERGEPGWEVSYRSGMLRGLLVVMQGPHQRLTVPASALRLGDVLLGLREHSGETVIRLGSDRERRVVARTASTVHTFSPERRLQVIRPGVRPS